jgi:hypothetical protein
MSSNIQRCNRFSSVENPLQNDQDDSSILVVPPPLDSPTNPLKRYREISQLSFPKYDPIFNQNVIYKNTPENLLYTDLQKWVDEKKQKASESNENKRRRTALEITPDPEYNYRKKAQKRILECYHKKESYLNLSHLQLSSLPKCISRFTHLQALNLSCNQLNILPTWVSDLTKLKNLDLSQNELNTLPKEIGNLTNLKILNLDNNQLNTLTEEISNLTHLEFLSLVENQLRTLPEEIKHLTELKELYLSRNQLSTLPEGISNFDNLEEIYLDNNEITTLPSAVLNYLEERFDNALDENPISQNLHEITAIKAGTDLKNLLKKWLDISPDTDLPSTYEKLLSEPSKDFLALLLSRLENLNYMPADCLKNPQKFRTRIQAILQKGCKSKEAMEALCTRARSATENCGDALIHELGNLELKLDLLQAGELDYQPLAKLLLKFHRQKKLDKYVEEFLKQRPHNESIATSLFFRIKLQDLLPNSAEDMIHQNCTLISKAEESGLIKAARKFITEDCQTLENQAKILCQMDPWSEKIEQHEDYKLFMDAMHTKLADLDAQKEKLKNEQEYIDSADALSKEIEQKKLDLTKEILKLIQNNSL